jgi:CheY-like chemotaxis protein
MQGWRILDRLKTDQMTRHIPVCVVSTDESRDRALQAGAIGFLAKPLQSKDAVDLAVTDLCNYLDRSVKNLLVAMPDTALRREFLAGLDAEVEPRVVDNVEDARAALADMDAVVIDESVPLLGPEDVRDALEQRGSSACQLSVVLFRGTNAGGAKMGDGHWHRHHRGFSLHEADTLDKLTAQVAFALHRNPANMSERERNIVEATYGAHRALEGKKALIVDDDMRNIFALAAVLDDEGMVIVSADNGREAIRLVQSDPDIDIVLMDIMMPEMDGIATMQEIRKLPRGRELPMVAVTAKAMKGDRQKCIEAGAWDYLSTPVDPMHLLAVLRGWLCR